MWIVFAALSALFAGLTAVLAKAGVASTASTVATAVRTIIVGDGRAHRRRFGRFLH